MQRMQNYHSSMQKLYLHTGDMPCLILYINKYICHISSLYVIFKY